MTKKTSFTRRTEKLFVLIVRKKIAMCICSNGTKNNKCLGPILIEKQTSGRRGKPVNVIKNIPLQKADLKKLAKELKKNLGVGGSCIDGDHYTRIA